MARTEVDALLRVMRAAFDGDPEHSLVANLGAVREEDWDRPPEGGSRTIYDMVRHVAECKWMYDDYAFRSASFRWDAPPVAPAGGRRTPAELVDWMREGQQRLIDSVTALRDDAELDGERPLNWGGTRPARGIVLTMIEHDLYHSGELNHARSLLQGSDRWAYDED